MAEQTFNQALFDSMVGHQIGLLRFSGSVRNQIWALLDATESDLKDIIRAHASRAGLDTPARRKRLEKMLAALRESRAGAWTEADAVWLEQMRGQHLLETLATRRRV